MKVNTKNSAWEEEERPQSFDEYIDEGDNLQYIIPPLENNQLRNIILWGNAGNGKTTLALLILKYWVNKQMQNKSIRNVEGLVMPRLIELNASDERGIDVVRTKIKGRSHTTGFFLDEADALTKDAQQALRRIMEKGKANVIHPKMFVLCVNYPNKIIEPLASRCDIYFIPEVSYDSTKIRCMGILKKRKITTVNWPSSVTSKEEKGRLFEHFWEYIYKKGQAEGGLRKCISELQKFCDEEKKALNIPANIAQLIPDVNDVFVLLDSIVKPIESGEETSYGQIWTSIRNLLYNPDAKKRKQPTDIIRAANEWLVHFSDQIPEYIGLEMSSVIGEIDYRIKFGTDPMSQFPTMFSKLRLTRLLGVIKEKQDISFNEMRQQLEELQAKNPTFESITPSEIITVENSVNDEKTELAVEKSWDEIMDEGYITHGWEKIYDYIKDQPRTLYEIITHMKGQNHWQSPEMETQEMVGDAMKHGKLGLYFGKIQVVTVDEEDEEEPIENMTGYDEQ